MTASCPLRGRHPATSSARHGPCKRSTPNSGLQQQIHGIVTAAVRPPPPASSPAYGVTVIVNGVDIDPEGREVQKLHTHP